MYKWTPGSWFEDQDFYRFSGIFRSVFLYVLPKTAVWDLSLVPTLSDDFLTGTLHVSARTKGEGSLRLSLHRDRKVLDIATAAIREDNAEAELSVGHPALWSAEIPDLYTLRIEVLDPDGGLTEVLEQAFGFRRFELKDGVMCLNGKRIVFRGVNRHEFSAREAVSSREELPRDIVTMKRTNINAIRTATIRTSCALPNSATGTAST